MTPNELHRTLNMLAYRAKANQEFFEGIDTAHYGKSIAVGNANYTVQQASDWLQTEELAITSDEKDGLMAHARSDMSRILTIVHRQATARGLDVIQLLAEGVEYEEAVVADIKAGRRRERSHKGLNAQDINRIEPEEA